MSTEKIKYLLRVNIGPVQGFIASARRARDLWFGSFILSELSKAAAKCLNDDEQHVRLIFPAVGNDEKRTPKSQLEPGTPFNVANLIIAEVYDLDSDGVRALVDAVKKAVGKRLKQFANDARDEIDKVEKQIHVELYDKELWEKQVGDTIEFYAAWIEYEGSNYQNVRKKLDRLISARKTLRDFIPNAGKDVPKSSLDGRRESVLLLSTKLTSEEKADRNYLKTRGDLLAAERSTLRDCFKKNEQLDAIGVIKRIAEKKSFPSVARVAIDPWLRGDRFKELQEEDRASLKGNCETLERYGAVSGISFKDSTIAGENDANYFNYGEWEHDAEALLLNCHPSIEKTIKKSPHIDPLTQLPFAKLALDRIKDVLRGDDWKPDELYLAVLCADGDKMGEKIQQLKTPDANRDFSFALEKFAQEARNIVYNSHGACIYTGGDDVLALLPMDTALECAAKLHNEFGKQLGKICAENGISTAPSLSVGVSIASAQEELEDLLRWGREAEKLAKNGFPGDENRNGLAVTLRSRGSSAIRLREQWKRPADTENTPLAELSLEQRLDWWSKRFNLIGKGATPIPIRFPYELRTNVQFYKNWKTDTDEEKSRLKRAIHYDVIRIFERKNLKLKDGSELGKLRDYFKFKLSDSRSLRRLADEMIMGQWLYRYGEEVKHLKDELKGAGTE